MPIVVNGGKIGRVNVRAFHENPNRIHTELTDEHVHNYISGRFYL